MTIDDIQDIKVGTAQVQKVMLGTALVWPTEVVETYSITNVSLIYSVSGASQIPASGGYAYFYGYVRKMVRGQVVEDLGWKVLTPHILSGDTSFFYISGTNIKSDSRGEDEGTRKGIMAGYSYATSEVSTGTPVYLEENWRDNGREWDQQLSDRTEQSGAIDYDWQVNGFGSDRYTTSAGACPASGTVTATRAGLSVSSAGHNRRYDTYVYNRFQPKITYTWTSGAEETYNNGSIWERYARTITGDPTWYNRPVIYSVYSQTAGGFSVSSNYVSIASEGTSDLPYGRSATIRASIQDYSGVTKAYSDITLYQAQNVIIPGVEEYISALRILYSQSSVIPGAGDTRYIGATSYNQRQDKWSSGSPAGDPVKTAVYTAVSVSSEGGTSTVSPISIQQTTEREVTLTVGKNPYGAQKSVTVQLKVSNVVKQTLTFTQEATPAVITSISASPTSIDFHNTSSQLVTITATYSDGTTADVSSQCSVSYKPSWVSVTNHTLLYITAQPQYRTDTVQFWLDSDHTKTTSVSVTG